MIDFWRGFDQRAPLSFHEAAAVGGHVHEHGQVVGVAGINSIQHGENQGVETLDELGEPRSSRGFFLTGNGFDELVHALAEWEEDGLPLFHAEQPGGSGGVIVLFYEFPQIRLDIAADFDDGLVSDGWGDRGGGGGELGAEGIKLGGEMAEEVFLFLFG